MLKRYTFFLLLFTVFAFDGFGQILTFDFAGKTGSEVSVVSNTNNAGLTTSTITRGDGLTASGNGDRFNATDWANPYPGSYGATDFMEFTITPNSGSKFSVTSIVIQFQRSSTGPRSLVLRSSADSYSTDLGGEQTVTDNTNIQTFTFTFTLSDNTVAVTFRLYGIAEAAAGAGGPEGTGNDIVVNGSVEEVLGSNDNDSDILVPLAQVSAQNISSLVDQSGEAVEVFKFRIQDKSTADALATKITNIRLTPGAADNADWSSVIQGVLVIKDGSNVTTGTITIVNDQINVSVPSGNLDIAAGTTSEITILVYLKNSGITDNQILAFSIPQTGHGFTTDPAGSGIASSITAQVSSNNNTIEVIATKLAFASYPATVDLNTNFTVAVDAVDANGNKDLDATNSVTLARTSGSGILSSTVGLTQSLSSGSKSWSDLQYNKIGTFSITATASGLTSVEGSNISCDETLSGATDLFISEYVEGGSNNKYIEIYNGTGDTVGLSDYKLRLFNNGSTSAGADVTLSGNLSNNSTVVYRNTSATVYGGSTIVSTVCAFNGNDAVALFKISSNSYVDIFGRIGAPDPGTEWSSGSHSTLNKTLRRKSSVTGGITTNPDLGFPTLETEWDLYIQDDVTGLGSHTFTPVAAGDATQTVAVGDNLYSFATTGVSIDFKSVTTGGDVRVRKYHNKAANISGVLETNKSEFRWVIQGPGLVFGATTEIRFLVSDLFGIGDPATANIKLYKRSAPGSGAFTLVGSLVYDGVDEFFVQINGFSEIIMASNDAPLPVELTSFTAKAIGSVVNLNWETATEVDNNGFDVERNSTGTWQKIGFVEGHGTANSPKYYNFTDKSVTGNKIQYRLRQVDNDGTFEYSNVVEVELAPTTFTLDQNYPNPFNPATMIRFSLPTTSVVTLNVYNTLGEKVITLLNGVMESGYHQVSFDAANLPSGLYLYEIKAGEFSSIKKMVLMK